MSGFRDQRAVGAAALALGLSTLAACTEPNLRASDPQTSCADGGECDAGPGCDGAAECAPAPAETCEDAVCDDAPLATCSMQAGAAHCACPSDFIGDGRGQAGCAPTLSGLTGNGVVSPALSPGQRSYRLEVFRLAKEASLNFEMPAGTKLFIDGAERTEATWTGSPGTTLQVELRFEGGSTGYTIETEFAAQVGEPASVLSTPRLVAGTQFGKLLASEGDLLLVGADGYALDSRGKPLTSNGGQVFVFDVASPTPTLIDTLFSDDPLSLWYGNAIAVHGDTVAVADYSYESDVPNSGAVFIYRRDASTGFARTQILRSTGHGSEMGGGLLFGQFLAMSDTLLAVLTREEEFEDKAGRHTGALYIYRRSDDGYTLLEKVYADVGRSFGSEVAVWGNRLFVGTEAYDGDGNWMRSFACGEAACIEQQPLTLPDPYTSGLVARHELLLLGQPSVTASVGVGEAGRAQAVLVNSSGLSLAGIFEGNPPRTGEHFGSMLALADDYAVITTGADNVTPYRVCTYQHGSVEPNAFLAKDATYVCENLGGTQKTPRALVSIPGGYAVGVPSESLGEEVALEAAGAVYLYR
jgi:hypothetical protein